MCSRNYQKRSVVLKRERSAVFLHDRTRVPHRPHPYITLGWFTSQSRSHIRPKGLQRPLQAQWSWECNIPSLKVPSETMLVPYPPIQGHLTGLELFHISYTNTAEQTVLLLDGTHRPLLPASWPPFPNLIDSSRLFLRPAVAPTKRSQNCLAVGSAQHSWISDAKPGAFGH